jgi:glycosyltransferase involved in cell wall biosynthesis
MENAILYLVWYSHARRAETLSKELQARLVFIYEPRLKGFLLNFFRYLAQWWKTWRLLERERPAFVIVQSPPVFAPLCVAIWCKLRGRKRTAYILDCHPGTFYDQSWTWALPLLRWLARGAVTSLLCNEKAGEYMEKWQAGSIFLPDGLPDLSSTSSEIGSEGERRVAVVCSMHNDEPIIELLAAARMVPEVTFYLTGDIKRADQETTRHIHARPANVTLTGFLRGSTYNSLLHNVDGVVVLSCLPTTLCCGAFEALSLAKPTILSDMPEQRKWFASGFLMVENTPEEIALAIKTLFSERTTYTHKAEILRENYFLARQPALDKLRALLPSFAQPARQLPV